MVRLRKKKIGQSAQPSTKTLVGKENQEKVKNLLSLGPKRSSVNIFNHSKLNKFLYASVYDFGNINPDGFGIENVK